MKFFDHKNKLRFKVTTSKKGLNLMSSIDGKKWKTEKEGITLEEIMKLKEEIINNNFEHLFGIISK